MPRLPKWLLQKEWLTFDDVLKVVDTASSHLVDIFSWDKSDEFKKFYVHQCTFAPEKCAQEFSEFGRQENALNNIRAHIKNHIQSMKRLESPEKDSFCTRNKMFKVSKARKHKAPLGSASPSIESTATKNQQPNDKAEPPSKKRKFTKLKKTAISPDDENLQPLSVPKEKFEVVVEDELTYDMPESPVSDGDESDLDESSEQEACGSGQTRHRRHPDTEKELETNQYKFATKLFAIDRSNFPTYQNSFEEMLRKEDDPDDPLTEEDKQKILEGMRRWVASCNNQEAEAAAQRINLALTPEQTTTLKSLTIKDWQRLEATNKPQFKQYAEHLLRDYEWYPRKLKPKICHHCNKKYTASTSLYSHLVSLSGIRFWCCMQCKSEGKQETTFTRKHSLQYHILKEVGIPRYRCSEPGCNKTHNHTHHQKSHARQHSGVKHYVCEVDDCAGQFSNRNTYSRHLLQFHNTELTRGNELQPMRIEDAQHKVKAARLKARERSKSKRQRTDPVDQGTNLRALTHVQCNIQNELSAAEAGDIAQYMQPSASHLLCKIAGDVRDTGAVECDSDLRGLDLLATVSKYMNAGDTITLNETPASERPDSPTYTKLIEALDIKVDNQVEVTTVSSSANCGQIPIISSLSSNKPVTTGLSTFSNPSCFMEAATVISKPSVLLPFPSIKTDPEDASTTTKLPNVIFDLKKRLLNAPNYTLPSQVMQYPTTVAQTASSKDLAQGSIAQTVASNGLNQQVMQFPVNATIAQTAASNGLIHTSPSAPTKIIVNMPKARVLTSPPVSSDSRKLQGNISTLLNTHFSAAQPSCSSQPAVTISTGSLISTGHAATAESPKVLAIRPLTGLSGKTYIVLSKPNAVLNAAQQPQMQVHQLPLVNQLPSSSHVRITGSGDRSSLISLL